MATHCLDVCCLTKIKRNAPCPCGSGLKYKKCCGDPRRLDQVSARLGSSLDLALERKLREIEAERVQREKQQGLGKGIISVELSGRRVVAVGNRLYKSDKWKTFQDFLRDYLVQKLGLQWFRAELAKPESERQTIVRWYEQAVADFRPSEAQIGDVFSGPMTGAQRAFFNLAYNLYLIEHHAPTKHANQLVETFVARLRDHRLDNFIGKLFETYAAAAFLKAGFSLSYENESDGTTSHVEFVATYPRTGKKFSVEVKTRNRAITEDGPCDDIRRLRVANKLNKALAKEAAHTRVVMIEVNLPDIVTESMFDGWPQAALNQIRYAERNAPNGCENRSAYVIVTNHAFHNNLTATGAGTAVLAAGYGIPDFGPDVAFNRFKAVIEMKERHEEILVLLQSMQTHYEIPSTFDGEIPEFVFGETRDPPRLKFGEWYFIPTGDGHETEGQLYEATVNEQEKTIYGMYKTNDGSSILATNQMTDAEVAAWKRHPETFFGEVRHVGKKVGNWLELSEFFYESYKDSPRDQLLEWMKGADDIEYLRTLSQNDLAILYCERLGWAGFQKGQNSCAENSD